MRTKKRTFLRARIFNMNMGERENQLGNLPQQSIQILEAILYRGEIA